jgi:hypothetical protein
MLLHEADNPLVKVGKHSGLHCMEDLGLKEVTNNTGNMSQHVKSSVNMARQDIGIVCLVVRIAEPSI